MSPKDVHVKSYMREGEKAREHWRSRPGEGSNAVFAASGMGVLKGGVEKTDISLDSVMNVIHNIAKKGKETWDKIPEPVKLVLGQTLLQAVLYNPSSATAAATHTPAASNAPVDTDLTGTLLKARAEYTDYNTEFYDNKPKVNLEPPEINKGLQKDVKTGMAEDNAFKNVNYIRQKALSQTKVNNAKIQKRNLEQYKSELENIYNRAGKKYNIDLKNREMSFRNFPGIGQNMRYMTNELQNAIKLYKKLKDGSINNNNFTRDEKTLNILKPYIMNSPHISKWILENGGQYVKDKNYKNAKPAARLLMASVDFGRYSNTIEYAKAVANYRETGPIQDFLKDKIMSQGMDPENTPGIIHGYNSEMSQALAQSEEIKQYISKYRKALKQGQLIPTVSEKFDSTKNLYWGINRADILLSYIDDNADLNIFVIDTYDFNKDDPSLLVNIAYSSQKANLITRYFNVFHVKIPFGCY